MIGILVIAHDTLGDSFVRAVTHVLGTRPPQFEAMSVRSVDDPLDLVPAARALLGGLDTGEGVLVVTDIYGASPSNLARKLLMPGSVEAVAGVSLPMLVRALTYRTKGMDTMVRKAISGGRDGVLRFTVDPVYAATRN